MTVCNIGSSIYNNKNLNEIINISVVAEEICSALHPEDIINSLSVSKNFNNQIKAILEIRLGGLIPAYPNLFNYLSDKVKAASNEMHQDAGKALKKYLNKMAFGNEVRAPQYGTQKIIEWFESIEPRGRGPASYLTWDGLDKLGVLSREDGVVAIRVAVEVVAEAARALSSEKTAEVVESVIIVQELEQIMARLDQAIQTAKILSMEKLIQIAGKARTAAQVAGQVAQTARSPIARQQAPLEVKKGYSAKLELERAIREIQEAQAIQAQEQNDQVLTPSQIHQEILDDNLINILSFHKKSDLINILNIDHQVLMDWCNTQLGDFIHLDELEKLMSMVKDEEIPFPVGRIGLTLFSYIQDKIKKGNKEIKEWWFKEKNYCDKNGSTLLHHAG